MDGLRISYGGSPADNDTFINININILIMHIKCDRPGCGHEWDYTGKSKFFAVCMMCRKQVKLTLSGKTAEKKRE